MIKYKNKYVCIYVYIYTYIHIHTYTHMHAHGINMYIYIYIYIILYISIFYHFIYFCGWNDHPQFYFIEAPHLIQLPVTVYIFDFIVYICDLNIKCLCIVLSAKCMPILWTVKLLLSLPNRF